MLTHSLRFSQLEVLEPHMKSGKSWKTRRMNCLFQEKPQELFDH